jgi:cystathionine beta-lyase/cystathionine gamma-synthase
VSEAHPKSSPPGAPGGFGTRAITAASRPPEVDQQPNAVPIYQVVTFSADDAGQLGDILSDRRPGYAYARIDNPTSSALAAAMAEIEGAQAAYCFASGMAAIHAALVALLRAGDHVVAGQAVYGSTRQLIERNLERFGVSATFVDATDPAALEAAMRPTTRVLYLETIANPTIVVSDLAALSALGHRHGLTVVVDNTFASPYLCRPLELGADLVIESATKWLGGHSDVMAGVVAGRRELIDQVRAIQIDTGGGIAPFSAYLVLRGIQTLHVRMDRHSANAMALARHLEAARPVRAMYYPGLPSHPQFEVAQRQLRAGGGMLAFDVGDRRAAGALLDALTIPPRTASLGSVSTMAVHPPSTTHRQLDADALQRAGIAEGLVRVSVGLEDVEDLIDDFDRGLAAAREALAVGSV